MKKRLISSLLSAFALAAFAGGAVAQDEAEGGDYYVTGTNPDGSEYVGGLEILQLGRETLQVTWQLSTPAYGVGLLNGNVFGVVVGGSECALSVYTESEDGLEGRWTSTTMVDAFSETATRIGDVTNGIGYEVEGESADGSTYEGTMIVKGDGGYVFTVEQVVGDVTYQGSGLLAGNVFAVAFGTGCTLATYIVEEGSVLSGAWVAVGGTEVGTETAQPIDISGTHNVEGTNPDKSPYGGTVDITADNQVHRYDWTTGETTSSGVGIMRGSSVAASFGGDNCYVASYFQNSTDMSLSGLWAGVESDLVGSERAVISEATSDDAFAGVYDILRWDIGDVAGTPTEGTLEIIPHDEVYELIWTFDDTETQGVGVFSNGILVAGFGGDNCGVAGYFVYPNELRGAWAVYGVDTVGTEILTR